MEDLGLQRGTKDEGAGGTTSTSDGPTIGGGGGFAAVKALVLGSTLMTAAQGASSENSGGTDYTPLVTTGAVLMALGAVYVGQGSMVTCDPKKRSLVTLKSPVTCDPKKRSLATLFL